MCQGQKKVSMGSDWLKQWHQFSGPITTACENKDKKHLKLNSKQLLDEVKHDSENSILRPRSVFAKGLDYSRYNAKTECDNCLLWIFPSVRKDDVRLENVVLDQFISQLFYCVIFNNFGNCIVIIVNEFLANE